jgi:hypothetical protein
MDREDFDRSALLAWAVQLFHALGLTQVIAVYTHAYHALRFGDFYEALLDFCHQHPETVMGRELLHIRNKLEDVFDHGGNWDDIVPEFSNLTWALEEASYLRIALDRDRFYREVAQFLDFLMEKFSLNIESDLRSDLLRYQQFIVVKYEGHLNTSLSLGHSLFSFHRGILTGEKLPLHRGRYRLQLNDPQRYDGDMERYATEVLFWGRRGGKAVYQDIDEELLDPVSSSYAAAAQPSA